MPGDTPTARLRDVLGVDVEDALLELALTHRSYAYEKGGLPTNERLEFLGDAVLGIAVTERLYRTHPGLPEGQLAKLRASVVNMHALAGVVHLQHGIEVSRALVERLFADLMTTAPQLGAGLDWKTSLQELTAARGLGVPEYRMTSEGPDHAKEFTATVVVADDDLGIGTGRTKKDAEQKAARTAYETLVPGAGDGAAGSEPSLPVGGA